MSIISNSDYISKSSSPTIQEIKYQIVQYRPRINRLKYFEKTQIHSDINKKIQKISSKKLTEILTNKLYQKKS